jgi:hypothetical protein
MSGWSELVDKRVCTRYIAEDALSIEEERSARQSRSIADHL